jgi:hypothetical protein
MPSAVSRIVERADQKNFKFYVDRVRARQVFDALIRRLSEKGRPYHNAHVPQSAQLLPANLKRGGREAALFMFVSCLWMRGGIESDTAMAFLKSMYEAEPQLFEPELFRSSGAEDVQSQISMIKSALTKYRLGQRVDENSLGWVYNMRKLWRFWSSDPRNIMNDQPSFQALSTRLLGKGSIKGGMFINEDKKNGFMFFREKMAAMLAYFLMDLELVPMFYTPVPVDFHVLRLLTANLILRAKGLSVEEAVGVNFYRAETLKLSRQVTEWYCRKYRISPIALCDSLWLLSRTLCRNNPGNSGYVFDGKRRAPATADRNSNTDFLIEPETSRPEAPTAPDLKGRKRYLGLKWSTEEMMSRSKVRRINDSCGVCPVNGFCRYNISSGAYYVKGSLLPERLRFVPPNGQHDFFCHEAFDGTDRPLVDETVRFTKITADVSVQI